MNYISKEKIKLERSKFEIKRRRINWNFVVKPRILSICKEFDQKLRSAGYPYETHFGVASKDPGSETIQFDYSYNLTGIVHNKDEIKNNRITHSSKKIIEKGCSIVFSQCPTGNILILLSPYESDIQKIKEENIILYNNCDPDSITNSKILACLNKSLFYARITSINGSSNGYSIFDEFKWFIMRIMDIRSRKKMKSNLLTLNSEWWKIITASILTLLITILYQNLFPIS